MELGRSSRAAKKLVFQIAFFALRSLARRSPPPRPSVRCRFRLLRGTARCNSTFTVPPPTLPRPRHRAAFLALRAGRWREGFRLDCWRRSDNAIGSFYPDHRHAKPLSGSVGTDRSPWHRALGDVFAGPFFFSSSERLGQVSTPAHGDSRIRAQICLSRE